MANNFEKDMKKKQGKKWIVVLVVAALVLGTVFGLDIRGAKDITDQGSEGETIKVTMSIDCKTAADNIDKLKDQNKNEYIPETGEVLKATEYEIEKDSSVFDLLTKATAAENIQMECEKDTVFGYYIEGINHLYSGDCGQMSGWLYYVNDEVPMYGVADFKLAEGDVVEFVYSCEGGEDLM